MGLAGAWSVDADLDISVSRHNVPWAVFYKDPWGPDLRTFPEERNPLSQHHRKS